MIFDKDFDKTLWLVVLGDKKNGDSIIEFINTIPYEVNKQITCALDKKHFYDENSVCMFDRYEFCIDGEVFFSNNVKYWFNVDMLVNSLTIGKGIVSGNEIIKVFEIILFADNTYNNIDEYGEKYLGCISSSTEKIHNVNYELVSSLLGKFLRTFNKDGFRRVKIIDTKDVPDDYDIIDLSKKRELVRTKRIN